MIASKTNNVASRKIMVMESVSILTQYMTELTNHSVRLF